MVSSRHHTATIVGIEVLAAMVLGLASQAGPVTAAAPGDGKNQGTGETLRSRSPRPRLRSRTAGEGIGTNQRMLPRRFSQ
jgi:hypothetical protein